MTSCEGERREVVMKLHVSNKVSVKLYFSLRCDGHASARFLPGLIPRITNVYGTKPKWIHRELCFTTLQAQEANMGTDRSPQHQKLSERKEN